ncbi:hypothetical protein [Rhodoferax sp.]|uniref:hypothetical protein n=1 Tax=Rhodoferax sp. TaxID=50421 RepID=UPI00374D96BF
MSNFTAKEVCVKVNKFPLNPWMNYENSKGAFVTNELVLVRGLPGSGKSSLADSLVQIGYRNFEASMFFENNGLYVFDGARIGDAHRWCEMMSKQSLFIGENVVVSNTFTRLFELAPYLAMQAGSIRVIEAIGTRPNIRGVSPEKLQRMAERWESFPVNDSVYWP